MLNSVHVIAAAAIVVAIPNPAASLPLAFASHIALDTIPHWNWSPGKSPAGKAASVADGVVALIIIGLLYGYLEYNWVMLAAGLLAMLPDIIQAPYHFWNWQPHWLQVFIDWESKRQKWPWMQPWMGIMTQAVVVIAAGLILLSI